MLKLTFRDCLVCSRDLAKTRDQTDLDGGADEEGRSPNAFAYYVTPRAAYRDRIAPDLCDHCWSEHRSDMLRRRWGRGGRGYCPPYRNIYLWEWVAGEMAKKDRRLVPHLARKADAGLTAMLRW